MIAALTFVVGLTLVGIVPAVTMAGLTPVSVFLSPLIGAFTAGVAVELELGLSGTLVLWFVIVAVLLNAAALGVLVRRGSRPAW